MFYHLATYYYYYIYHLATYYYYYYCPKIVVSLC